MKEQMENNKKESFIVYNGEKCFPFEDLETAKEKAQIISDSINREVTILKTLSVVKPIQVNELIDSYDAACVSLGSKCCSSCISFPALIINKFFLCNGKVNDYRRSME